MTVAAVAKLSDTVPAERHGQTEVGWKPNHMLLLLLEFQ